MSMAIRDLDLKPVPGLAGKVITVSSTPVVIAGSANAFDPVQVPYVYIEFAMNTNALRFRTDGVNPTTTEGILKGQYSQQFMPTQTYNAMRLIRTTGSDSTMIVLPMTI
jgi:hypothetical protein